MNKKIIEKVTALFFALVVVLGASATLFTTEVSAASTPAKPARVYRIQADANGYGKLTVSWSKVKKASGYQLEYRTLKGKWVKCPRQKTRKAVFKPEDLKPKTYYQFRVRAFKSYKEKQWYNTKTKEWVNKKPKKKYIGDTRTVTKYRYGKYSKLIKIKTDKKFKATTKNSSDTNKIIPVEMKKSYTVYLSKGGTLTIKGTATWNKPSYISDADKPIYVDVLWEQATFTFLEPTPVDKDGNPKPITIKAKNHLTGEVMCSCEVIVKN